MKLLQRKNLGSRRLAGYLMAVVGFLMLFSNALGYLFDWNRESTPFLISGLVLVVTGMNLVRKTRA